MAATKKNFRLARQVAIHGDTKEAKRQYRLGAVGVRNDGTTVVSNNVPHRTREKRAHAETRLVRKLDWGATVYVVRITSDGKLANSRPCIKCEAAMRLRGVKRCFYSINESEYGVINF
jgi:tRNA(Arg) A34 adenosine deaminase TadA